jgi:two-component system, LytTR family, response regulator
MIKCIIVDDIEAAIEVIEFHLKSRPDFRLKATFTNALEALEYALKEDIDLIFLDVDMPKLNGLDFMERLTQTKKVGLPSFILITGFTEYAVQSYEYSVIDYIVKPVTLKRFNLALEKYIESQASINKRPKPIEDFFFADHEGKKVRVNFEDIIYIESTGNYISIYKSEGRITIYKTLQSTMDILDSHQFIRVHKSYIVAVKHLVAIDNSELILLGMKDPIKVPLGTSYKQALAKRMKFM